MNCYEITANGVQPRAQMRHDAPVLCSDISNVIYRMLSMLVGLQKDFSLIIKSFMFDIGSVHGF